MHYLKNLNLLSAVSSIHTELYGSLALTGEGHGTKMAIILGLSHTDPVNVPRSEMEAIILKANSEHFLHISGKNPIRFNPDTDILYKFGEALPFHSNGIRFNASDKDGFILGTETYFSIGGGFIVNAKEKENAQNEEANKRFPFPVHSAKALIQYCDAENKSIAEIVLANEKSLREEAVIFSDLLNIWQVMLHSVYTGCHKKGILPGGLGVKRRAAGMCQKLIFLDMTTGM